MIVCSMDFSVNVTKLMPRTTLQAYISQDVINVVLGQKDDKLMNKTEDEIVKDVHLEKELMDNN